MYTGPETKRGLCDRTVPKFMHYAQEAKFSWHKSLTCSKYAQHSLVYCSVHETCAEWLLLRYSVIFYSPYIPGRKKSKNSQNVQNVQNSVSCTVVSMKHVQSGFSCTIVSLFVYHISLAEKKREKHHKYDIVFYFKYVCAEIVTEIRMSVSQLCTRNDVSLTTVQLLQNKHQFASCAIRQFILDSSARNRKTW